MTIWKTPTLLAVIAGAMSLTACNGGDPDPLVVPTDYDGSTFTANVNAETEVLTQLGSLSSAMKAADGGNAVTTASLTAAFNSDLAIYNVSSTYYTALIEGWLPELAAASGNTFDPFAADRGQGGHYGSHLFDENGIEIEQLVEKGLYGAGLYNHATSIIAGGNLSPANIDQLVAIVGASPSFANSDKAAENADKYIAKYIARRDKNDGQGFYTSMAAGAIQAQAAVVAGADYTSEMNAGVEAFVKNWEMGNAATVINYCLSAIEALSATSPTDDDRANSLHALSEAAGFMWGWRTVNNPYQTITDAQIDEVLVLLKAPVDGQVSMYEFVTDPVNTLGDLQSAIDKLKGIYGFTDAQVDDFAFNWVSVQDRQ